MVLCDGGLGLADIVNGQAGDALGGLGLGCWENRGLVRVVSRLLLVGKGSLGGLSAYPASVGGEVGSGMEAYLGYQCSLSRSRNWPLAPGGSRSGLPA